jgi:phage terminase small subunit
LAFLFYTQYKGWEVAKAKKRKAVLNIKAREARAAKYELFCLEYIKDQNASRAARDVGYSDTGVGVTGVRLLANPYIKARIKTLLDERAARVLLSGDEILLGIKELAVSDIRRIFNVETQCWLPMAEWPDDIARCVSAIESTEIFKKGVLVGYLKKVKLWEKPKSQENLGRNKGLFKDVVESKVNATVVSVDEAQVKATLDKIRKDF